MSEVCRCGLSPSWARSPSSAIGFTSTSTPRGSTEAVDRLLDEAFNSLGYHKVTLRIAVGNNASDRVAEKLGFTAQGVLREELLIRGNWVDHSLWSLLDREFRRYGVAKCVEPMSRLRGGDALRAWIDDRAARNQFSGVALVRAKGDTIFSTPPGWLTVGTACWSQQRESIPGCLGAKAVTAATALKMVEEGGLASAGLDPVTYPSAVPAPGQSRRPSTRCTICCRTHQTCPLPR